MRLAEITMAKPTRKHKGTAKVFMSGRSQAVRLPQEFRFASNEVSIRKVGESLVLSPLYADWNDYLAHAPRVGDDFVKVMAQREELPLEQRESFD
jgi:antitoxin VapB